MQDDDLADYKKYVIDQFYNGELNEYNKHLDFKNAETINFRELAFAESTLPEYTRFAYDLIKFRLGYLPTTRANMVKVEPSIRIAIQRFRQKQIDFDQLIQETDHEMKLIRKRELRFDADLKYEAQAYNDYLYVLPEYREKAKARIVNILGYEPPLDTYVKADQYLRYVMANDQVHLGNEITEVDYQVLTVIKYREILIRKGKEAADNSPLLRDTL